MDKETESRDYLVLSFISSAFTVPVIYVFIHLTNTYEAHHVLGPGRTMTTAFVEVTEVYSRKNKTKQELVK